MKNKIFIFLVCSLLALGAAQAYAQFDIASDLAVETFPNFPGSNEKVSITLSSFANDLARAEITWSVDGKITKRGIGITTLTLTTGKVGTQTKIDVAIKNELGLRLTKSITLRPADADLVWYAHGYTPPLYKGKTLHASGGIITVAALPNFILRGIPLKPESLFYTWKRGDKILSDSSGLGKQTLTFAGAQTYGKDEISVEVSTQDRSLSAETQVIIEPEDPLVLFYEDKPLGGTAYAHAFGNTYFLSKPEITLRAETYFFPTESLGASTQTWKVNSAVVAGNPAFSRIITLRQNSGASGEARVEFTIDAPEKLFLQAKRAVTIYFGNI